MGGYMQQLIEAVNASNATTFLDWAPIILSVISVLIAVYIPVKLARKENQIAIFEKLYAAYSQLLIVRGFAGSIEGIKFSAESRVLEARELYGVCFETSFGYRPNLIEEEESIGKALVALRKNELQTYMIPLLISNQRQKRKKTRVRRSSLQFMSHSFY